MEPHKINDAVVVKQVDGADEIHRVVAVTRGGRAVVDIGGVKIEPNVGEWIYVGYFVARPTSLLWFLGGVKQWLFCPNG